MRIVSQEAAYWLIRWTDDGAAMPLEDRLEFVRWIKQSPENIREFLHAMKMDSTFSRRKLSDQSTKVDTTVVHADFGSGTFLYDYQPCRSVSDKVPRKRKPVALRTWFSTAAALLMAVALIFVLASGTPQSDGVIEVAAGRLQQTTIEDGSILQMDARTRLKVDMKPEQRIIHLYSGQAVFEVVSNRKRPFTVRTHLADVTAVGTKFGVRVDETGVTATVLEGIVEVSPHDREDGDVVRLHRGEKLHIPKVRIQQFSELQKFQVNAQRELEWTSGWITLRQAEIGGIAKEFNRRHKPQVRIEDPLIAARKIDYARLKVTSVEDFELLMKSQLGIAVTNDGSVITLTRSDRSE